MPGCNVAGFYDMEQSRLGWVWLPFETTHQELAVENTCRSSPPTTEHSNICFTAYGVVPYKKMTSTVCHGVAKAETVRKNARQS